MALGQGRLAKVYTRGSLGLTPPLVVVEAHIAPGLPSFSIVGLPEGALRESRERVRSAIINSGFTFPQGRITVSLAPANLPKQGSRYDLPIALALLMASGQLAPVLDITQLECYAELGLDGTLRSTEAPLPAVLATQQAHRLPMLSSADAAQCRLVGGGACYQASSLLQVCTLLLQPVAPEQLGKVHEQPVHYAHNLSQVKGQHQARRALEIAAAGGHHLLLTGAPGSGKSLLAQCLPSIMPPLTLTQARECALIYALATQPRANYLARPFRAPHHSASVAAMIGGGSLPRPGEISLAHQGVLFLDELAEFPRQVLESLRQPLEAGEVHISRAQQQLIFPANFQLVAAMNPCPCGYYGDGSERCHCSEQQIAKYQSKVSGPLVDRLDMVLTVLPLKQSVLLANNLQNEHSDKVRDRVIGAYNRQLERQGRINAQLSAEILDQTVPLKRDNQLILERIMNKLSLSARSYYRILRVARTIADLAASKTVERQHLIEAASYRRDR